jgi:hypothetical protein
MKIAANLLKNIFENAFKNEKKFITEEGNPFLITFERKSYYVFLKNISPAYYPKYPDITRIQLPYSAHFKKISLSNIPFIILGYNSEYETFTGWDPSKIKNRLNNKSNVSLFSRDSFQEKLPLNDFRKNYISNGDKIIVFSVKSTPIYFKSYLSLFKSVQKEQSPISNIKLKVKAKRTIESHEALEKINDPRVSKKILDFKSKNDLIGAVLFCCENFKKDLVNTDINDWTKIMTKLFYSN